MKKRRNRLISIALSIGLCAGLAACSGNSGSSDSGKKEDGKTEVTIWIREQRLNSIISSRMKCK